MGLHPEIPLTNGSQKALVIIPVVSTLLAAVAVGLRVLARRISNRQLDASDYTMFAALAVTTCFAGLIAAEPFTGAGMHMTDLIATYGMAPFITYAKMTVANQILWSLAVCLPKVSILILYSRLFTMHIFIRAAQATGVLIVLLVIATILGAFLQCQPFAYNWDQTIPGGHCGDQVLSFKITGSINIVLDIVVLILPMPYLFTLQLALSRRIILAAAFAGGFVTCIFSILRIYTIATMSYTDLTYDAVEPSIYSVLEPTLSITLACVPVLRPLLGGSKYSATGTRVRGKKYSGPDTGGSTVVNIGSGSKKSARGTRQRVGKKDTAGFQTLVDGEGEEEGDDSGGGPDDSSSQYRLRPLGPRSETVVSGRRQDGADSEAGTSVRSEAAGSRFDGCISVRQEWEVKVV